MPPLTHRRRRSRAVAHRQRARQQLYGGHPITHFYRTEAMQRIRNRRFKMGVYRSILYFDGIYICFLEPHLPFEIWRMRPKGKTCSWKS